MEYPIAELADRYTILQLKRNHGLDVEEELEEATAALAFVDIDTDPLYRINKQMWYLEENITACKDVGMIGYFYGKLRALGILRMLAKNDIAEKHGGHLERKSYE